MGFEKGHPKYGGMKKGYKYPQKHLAPELELRNIDLIDEILKEIPNLDPKQRVDVWMKMLEYIYIKTSALQVTGEEGAPVLTLKYSFDQKTDEPKDKETKDETTPG